VEAPPVSRIGELAYGLWQVVVPTPLQAVSVLVLSFWFLTLANISSIMGRLGITPEGVDSGRAVAVKFLNNFFGANLMSSIALVLFWAGVGFGVYLICWSVYGTMVSLRNRVVLESGYRNRGSSVAGVAPMLFNAISGVALILYAFTFVSGFNQWLDGTQSLVQTISAASLMLAVFAIVGLALQLYIFLVLVQLTLTPWYAKAFTK
jgi:hypothetical protein